MLIKILTHVQIILKMVECTIECEVNLTEKPKNISRNLGADYKGHWHDESSKRVFVRLCIFSR